MCVSTKDERVLGSRALALVICLTTIPIAAHSRADVYQKHAAWMELRNACFSGYPEDRASEFEDRSRACILKNSPALRDSWAKEGKGANGRGSLDDDLGNQAAIFKEGCREVFPDRPKWVSCYVKSLNVLKHVYYGTTAYTQTAVPPPPSPPPNDDLNWPPPPPPPRPPEARPQPQPQPAPPTRRGCGMWIPCCPDGTPVVGTNCTPCQMNPANCSRSPAPSARNDRPVPKPSISANRAGSSILFNVTNSSSKEFSCTLSWAVSWNDFGQAGGNTLNRTVVVRSNQNGLLMQDNTTHSNLELRRFSYNCN